jgi:methylated-DNA-[protein]-cysteine S-methyltransferase
MDGRTYLDSPLGTILIACNGKAITRILFMDEGDPARQPEQTSDVCILAKGQLQEYFLGERSVFDFPVFQPGTEFQQRVWKVLSEIPFGKTITYAALAQALGDPRCIRAAASANGKNQLAIVVPCHRVIGTGGKLIGYAGGLWRKQWLLVHENERETGLRQGSLF